MLEGVQKRFEYVYENKLFALATFFDPTTKDDLPASFLSESYQDNILNQVNLILHTINLYSNIIFNDANSPKVDSFFVSQDHAPSPTKKPKIFSRVSATKPATRYFSSNGLNFDTTAPTIVGYLSAFPSFFRVCYVTFCGVVAASVDVERLWSSAGNIMSEKRNRLDQKHLVCERFVKQNIDIKKEVCLEREEL